MAQKPVIIDWQQDCLSGVCSWVLQRYTRGRDLDLRGVIIATPSSRAGRRLLELLIAAAESNELVLLPPCITTTGGLPELLYPSLGKTVTDLQRVLFWSRALESVAPEILEAIWPKTLQQSAIRNPIPLGRLVDQLYVELSGAAIDFADVARVCSDVGTEREVLRWNALSRIQESYCTFIERAGASDLFQQRQAAVLENCCSTKAEVLLIATVEVNPLLREMLGQLGDSVIPLIHADEQSREYFDELGCLKPSSPPRIRPAIAFESISVVDWPTDQALKAVEYLHAAREEYSKEGEQWLPENCSIGLPDSRLGPEVAFALERSGAAARVAAGTPMKQSSPARFLKLCVEYLRSRKFPEFAALVRHPDVLLWLKQNGGSSGVGAEELKGLDEFQSWHLQATLAAKDSLRGRYADRFNKLRGQLEQLLSPLSSTPQSIARGIDEVRQVFQKLYGESNREYLRSSDRDIIEVCQQIAALCAELEEHHDEAETVLSPADCMTLLHEGLFEKALPPDQTSRAVEILGWLELHLDDAPTLVIIGCNEGYLPQSVGSDAFLPDGLRTRIGLASNAQRYQRDCYLLRAIQESRSFVRFVAGRRDGENNPMLPGRVLYECADSELTKRISAFLTDSLSDRESRFLNEIQVGELRDRTLYAVPEPSRDMDPAETVSVTAFRDYLRCPYRFYLKHILGLKSLHDGSLEMDALRYGTLAHSVLRRFGESDCRQSTDIREIQNFLDDSLDRQIAMDFGKSCLPAAQIQIEQLRYRLHAFAQWQASWSQEGWRIQETEYALPGGATCLETCAGPLDLRGRIDRIDYHEREKRWVIFDYKTGEEASTPEATHRRSEAWIDLQLPAYRYALRKAGFDGAIDVGYIALPKQVDHTGAAIATWSTEDYDEAESVMRNTANSIRMQQFWPPAEEYFRYDEFRWICRAGQFLPEGDDLLAGAWE